MKQKGDKSNYTAQKMKFSINTNKAGFFEGSFFLKGGGEAGGQFDPPFISSYFKKNLSNSNITLCNC